MGMTSAFALLAFAPWVVEAEWRSPLEVYTPVLRVEFPFPDRLAPTERYIGLDVHAASCTVEY